jgi:hypothetical protein
LEVISARALDRCASVKPKGVSSSFCAISRRPDVDAAVGLTVDDLIEALRAEVEEERSVVIS